MKKITVITMLALALNMFSPVLPQAHAAILDDLISQAVAQNPTAAGIQGLLQVKESLEAGDRDAVMSLLAQTALERTGRSDLAGVAAAALGGGDLKGVVQTAVRQQVEQRVVQNLGQYQDVLTVLTTLFQNSTLNPGIAQETGAPENYRKIIDMTATAYGPGVKDNGRWNDLTYVGTKIRKGVVAVDPRIIPMGTKLWVEGYGQAVAEDQGSAIKGNRIDLAFDTRQEAVNYGIKPVKVYVLD
jgi:3D (Asp-Asp-Asp) domain-containing protein